MQPTQPIPLAPDVPALFLDDRVIDRTLRLSRAWHQPRKVHGPVLKGSKSWDRAIVSYGTVIRHNGLFYHWYMSWTRKPSPRVCVATSKDGLDWDKPHLGLHEAAGDKSNNIILVSDHESAGGLIDNISVIHEPTDTRFPFKALYWDSGPHPMKDETRGIHAARSSDGLHWEKLGVVMPGVGDRFNAAPTRIGGKYVAWIRARDMFRPPPPIRKVYRVESDDLFHWTSPELVLQPDHEDPDLMQHYSASGFEYAGLTLGFLERMYVSPDRLDSELIWSYDHGRTFHRARTRPTFLNLGPPGSWDDNWLSFPSNAPIIEDGRLWFYYSGRTEGHGMPTPHLDGSIGLATLRIDGFCSLHATHMPGTLLTRPLLWPGGDLHLNFDGRRNLDAHPTNTINGELQAEIQDLDGNPLPGMTLDDCNVLRRNTALTPGTYEPVTWKSGASMKALAQTGIRIRFVAKDGHLYGFKSTL